MLGPALSKVGRGEQLIDEGSVGCRGIFLVVCEKRLDPLRCGRQPCENDGSPLDERVRIGCPVGFEA